MKQIASLRIHRQVPVNIDQFNIDPLLTLYLRLLLLLDRQQTPTHTNRQSIRTMKLYMYSIEHTPHQLRLTAGRRIGCLFSNSVTR